MTDAAHRGTLAVVGYGFIGRRIARLASDRGWAVRALSRHVPPGSVEDGIDIVLGDAVDRIALGRLLEGADRVVFAAGTVKPAESNDHPITEATANLGPLLVTLEEMVVHRVPAISFLSSGGTVYGPSAPVPAGEDAQLWPISTYGVLKVAGERYLHLYAHQHGIAADILRCANVYGPGEPTSGSQGLIGVTRARLHSGKPIVLFGDGSTRRDFVHVDDVAHALVSLASSGDGTRLFNVGSGESVTIRSVVEALAEAAGISPVYDLRPQRATDVPVVELDITKLRAEIDFAPRAVLEFLRSALA